MNRYKNIRRRVDTNGRINLISKGSLAYECVLRYKSFAQLKSSIAKHARALHAANSFFNYILLSALDFYASNPILLINIPLNMPVIIRLHE